MNTKIRMSILLAASLLAACAGTVPASRSAAGPDEDRDVAEAGLAADVRLALLDKLGWDALDVKVDVDGGEARLTGEVDKRTTQELAEEVALSVQGVERVDNRLRLKPQSAPETRVDHAVSNTEREVNDAALEMRVGKNLLAEIGRYALDLEVEVTDGVASVRGTVPDRERKSLALKAAERTSGVKKVIDLIEVRGR
ncbi:MAG TPA: BON domain-containing protein [Thermoanaerobaculia bacterium]|nr:BON domain-containing protein [Thermoanaerobaculia bacterium]